MKQNRSSDNVWVGANYLCYYDLLPFVQLLQQETKTTLITWEQAAENPKNGSASYFYLIAIFGYCMVPPSAHKGYLPKSTQGSSYGSQIYIYTESI